MSNFDYGSQDEQQHPSEQLIWISFHILQKLYKFRGNKQVDMHVYLMLKGIIYEVNIVHVALGTAKMNLNYKDNHKFI